LDAGWLIGDLGGCGGGVLVDEVALPVGAFRDALEELEAAEQEGEDVGDDDVFADDPAERAEGQGKADDIDHEGLAVDPGELVVVLEVLRVSCMAGMPNFQPRQTSWSPPTMRPAVLPSTGVRPMVCCTMAMLVESRKQRSMGAFTWMFSFRRNIVLTLP